MLFFIRKSISSQAYGINLKYLIFLSLMANLLKIPMIFKFLMTDNISKLLELHLKNKKICTITCVRPTAKFGEITLSSSKVVAFEEKPRLVKGWINGGFMVCESNIFDFIPENDCMFEREPMKKLVKSDQLSAFKHEGFWKCMDSKKDKDDLESIWKLNNEWPV